MNRRDLDRIVQELVLKISMSSGSNERSVQLLAVVAGNLLGVADSIIAHDEKKLGRLPRARRGLELAVRHARKRTSATGIPIDRNGRN